VIQKEGDLVYAYCRKPIIKIEEFHLDQSRQAHTKKLSYGTQFETRLAYSLSINYARGIV